MNNGKMCCFCGRTGHQSDHCPIAERERQARAVGQKPKPRTIWQDPKPAFVVKK